MSEEEASSIASTEEPIEDKKTTADGGVPQGAVTEEQAKEVEASGKDESSQDVAEKPVVPIKSMNDLITKAPGRLRILEAGDMIKGRILSVGKTEVYVDVDGIGIGVVRGRELYDDEQVLSALKPGDEVYASVVDVENKESNIELSFRKAGQERVWQSLRDKLESKEVLATKILEANKGGLMVRINNVSGFLPVSQLAPTHYPRVEDGDKNKILSILKTFVGEDFNVVIITADPEGEKLVVSERVAIEGDIMEKIGRFAVGDVVEGEITGVVDFGAFIKFGEDLEGLIHISELAWQRIEDPRDIAKVGDDVKAQIISIDKDRVSLSLKRLQKDPWEDAVKKYKVGQIVTGKVIKLAPYGAFVELDEDIHGLVHLGELSRKEIEDPSEVLKEDEEYEFKIISIEPAEHRLGLSLKEVSGPALSKEDEEEKKVPTSEGVGVPTESVGGDPPESPAEEGGQPEAVAEDEATQNAEEAVPESPAEEEGKSSDEGEEDPSVPEASQEDEAEESKE